MTLENKLGITSSAELATQEERLSKKRALELFESGMLDKLEAGTFKTLQTIHKQLFMDIYDFCRQGSLCKHCQGWHSVLSRPCICLCADTD